LKIGDPAPGFFLRTPHGVEVSLTACLLEGAVLVEFIRGTWDPDARRRLGALAAERERFREAGARIVVIACERPGPAASYLAAHPSPLTVLLDEDRRVARSYGVLQRFSLPLPNVARPASFVVDRCGFIRYAYVARLQVHSSDLEEVLAALKTFDAGRPGGDTRSRPGIEGFADPQGEP
jgi:peroxiredoxin